MKDDKPMIWQRNYCMQKGIYCYVSLITIYGTTDVIRIMHGIVR